MTPGEGDLSRVQEALGSKYQVLRWIGGGGMAQVYLARHRTTGGLFAVKVLANHLSGEDAIVARFLQEARTAAALSGHPNIVSIFDVGQLENTHFIIMQYVEGEDLTAYLKRRGKLPPEEAARVVEQIAEALVFAHPRKVVHRDLKPSNVRINNTGRVVVLDFGIAKAGDAPSQLTIVGQRVGTPYYMSPEHFVGGSCDARSDLYALGVVFFELLTGRRPFDGDSVQDVEDAHVRRPAPSPSAVDPSVPEVYGRIVLRLLEKQPENRYQSAADLAADLRRVLGGAAAAAQPEAPPAAQPPAPVPSTPVAVPTKVASAPPRRRAWVAAMAVAAVLVLLAGVGAALYFRAAPASAPARRPAMSTATAVVDDAPVTNTTFKAFCDDTGHPYPDPLPERPNYFYAEPDAPVLNVTYKDAAAFAGWAGKRLLSGQEWDEAAKKSAGAVFEWTSTPYSPESTDVEAFRKLSGTEPRGDWYVVKGGAPIPAMPSESRPGNVAVGFRCLKEVAR